MRRNLIASLFAATLAATVAAQAPCFDTNFGPTLGLGDDQISAPLPLGFSFTYAGVAYTDISVCSNGYILLGSTNVATPNGGDYSPTEAELLASAQPRICPLWLDFNTTIPGSGQIFMDTSTPGVATVTWFRVYTYGTTTPSTFQVRLDASNAITLTYGQLGTPSAFQANTTIIGASPGAGATSNIISLATRPQTFASNTFADVISRTPSQNIPYSNIKVQFTPTNPGFVLQDVACTPNVASAFVVGQGCPGALSPVLYETFNAANPNDLNGRELSFLPSGSDYVALTGVSPTWFAGFTNNLAALDESVHSITLPFAFPYNGNNETVIHVSSNGFLTIGNTPPAAEWWDGDINRLLNGLPRIAGWWEDLDPSSAGGVFGDFDAATGEYVVTWNNVPQWLFTLPNTFQIALHPSGRFTLRWNTLNISGYTLLTGYSRGGGVPDSGVQDLSSINGAIVPGAVRQPMTLSVPSGSSPTLGGTFTMDANNIAAAPNGVFSILLVSNEIPGGVPLDALGLTGCTAYAQLPELVSFFNVTLGAPSTSYLLNIPNAAAFAGVTFMSQAVSDDLTANAFGFRVSNGVRWTIGL